MSDPAAESAPPEGFVAFFRRYARTWVHGVATAGLTAFGTLTVVHRGFAALALAAYAVPPVALYLSETWGFRDGETRGRDDAGSDSHRTDPARGDSGGTAVDGVDAGAPGFERADDAVPRGSAHDATCEASGWRTADLALQRTLLDAAVTPAGAFAVGEDGVVVSDRGDGWTPVLEDGPGAAARTLRGVDATADGAAVWTAGDGGSLARIDAGSGRHVDYSAPEGITDAWADVAVAGQSGAETLLLVNGSGEVLRGRYRDGQVAWTGPVKPGGGSSFSGVDVGDDSTAYLCDTNDGVFETREGRGDSDPARAGAFHRVGIEGADGTLTDVTARRRGDCLASADDGVVHRYDGSRWTPDSLGEDAVRAVARHEGLALACSGTSVHERSGADGTWHGTATPATGTLRGVAAGPNRAVAVGDDGVVVERRL